MSNVKRRVNGRPKRAPKAPVTTEAFPQPRAWVLAWRHKALRAPCDDTPGRARRRWR